MEDITRRVALTLGFTTAPGLVVSASAVGKEIAPGVRQVDLGAAPSMLSGYKAVSMRDLVFQLGANTFDPMAQNDMIGFVTHGLIRLRLGERELVAKKDLAPWTTPKGMKTAYQNTGADVAVLRIIDLMNA